MSETGFRIEIPVHIKRDQRARKVLTKGEGPRMQGPLPRLARLLALGWKWELAVRQGATNYPELAREHGISTARVSQICALTLLPPERQECLLENRSGPPGGSVAILDDQVTRRSLRTDPRQLLPPT